MKSDDHDERIIEKKTSEGKQVKENKHYSVLAKLPNLRITD